MLHCSGGIKRRQAEVGGHADGNGAPTAGGRKATMFFFVLVSNGRPWFCSVSGGQKKKKKNERKMEEQ